MNSHQSAKYIFVDIYGYQDICYYNKIDEIINKLHQKFDKLNFQEKDKSINIFVNNKKIAIIIGITNDDFIKINEHFNEKNKTEYQTKYQNEYKFDCQNEYKFDCQDEYKFDCQNEFYSHSDEDSCDNCGGYSCQEYCVNDNFD